MKLQEALQQAVASGRCITNGSFKYRDGAIIVDPHGKLLVITGDKVEKWNPTLSSILDSNWHLIKSFNFDDIIPSKK